MPYFAVGKHFGRVVCWRVDSHKEPSLGRMWTFHVGRFYVQIGDRRWRSE